MKAMTGIVIAVVVGTIVATNLVSMLSRISDALDSAIK